jgi:hypothetical protein
MMSKEFRHNGLILVLSMLYRIADFGCYLGLVFGIGWPGIVLSHQFSQKITHLPWDKALLQAFLGMALGFSMALCAGLLREFARRSRKSLKRQL